MTNLALAISATTPNVFIHDGKAVTTSVAVAEYFHKLHKNVIQKIETLDCSPQFASANFSANVQNVEIGNGATRDSKIYEMTKDGFVFLVMGFTGKKAAAFKEAYIAEFNRMEAGLTVQPEQTGTQKTHTVTLTDEELCQLCWLWKITADFRNEAAAIHPALEKLGSRFAAHFYDMANQRSYTLNTSRQALIRMTSGIEATSAVSNWCVLPEIRRIH